MTILTAANNLEDFRNDPQTRRAHGHRWSKYDDNGWNTRDLVLNVMATCARWHDLDIHNDAVADELYWICCGLEDFPEGEGFGSSDHYSYSRETVRVFHIVEQEKQS